MSFAARDVSRRLWASLFVAIAVTCGVAEAAAQSAPPRVPREEVLTQDNLPGDVKLALWGILLRLYGQPVAPSDGVVFDQVSWDMLGAAAPVFQDLTLTKTTIGNYAPLKGDPPRIALDGTFAFANRIGRRVAVLYSADYSFGEDGIAISRATAVPLYPHEPKPDMFLIPASRVPQGFNAAAGSYEALYGFAAARALKVNANEAPPAGRQPYFLVLAFPDRLPPAAKVGLIFSSQPNQPRSGDLYDFLGWRIYILQSQLALDSDAPTVEVTYNSAMATADGKPADRIVARFILPKAQR